MSDIVPDHLRVILLFLTVVSFLPQCRKLRMHPTSDGISVYYVLANLIIATELFAISFSFLVNGRFEGSDIFVNDPPTTGDNINIVQLALVCLLWLIIFVDCLAYPSLSNAARFQNAVTIYVGFLLVSVVPLLLDALSIGALFIDARDKDHRWLPALFRRLHLSFINPVMPVVGFSALYFQAREILSRPTTSRAGALSLSGLALQAVVFDLLAVSWMGRLVFPWKQLVLPDEGDLQKAYRLARMWYELGGFVAVDNAILALVQASVLLLSVCRGSTKPSTRETQPLLGIRV
ncbi:hypothetical protein CTRI78_v001885 [Colletotrichum trifolii]|uniref:Uncharacterized protein n=1 Tax=Colletotrichum trifolii TaxID=5466 RepID=A0A4R8RYB6_COLTR|nr:hypothetical protein CTRI78_v001885 [Colletotrichum trifolii]